MDAVAPAPFKVPGVLLQVVEDVIGVGAEQSSDWANETSGSKRVMNTLTITLKLERVNPKLFIADFMVLVFRYCARKENIYVLLTQ